MGSCHGTHLLLTIICVRLAMKKYNKLRKQYPEIVTLEQVRIICKIAKRTAKFLLEEQIIPCCIDENRKTWKYKVHIDDVIAFLVERDKNPSLGRKPKTNNARTSFSRLIDGDAEKENLFQFFFERAFDYPDVLNIREASEITGITERTIKKLAHNHTLSKLPWMKEVKIPRICLLEYIQSQQYIDIWSDTEQFREIMAAYIQWSSDKAMVGKV